MGLAMQLDELRVESLLDVLMNDEVACLAACRAQGGGQGMVPLIEGLVTPLEALDYARVLAELGHVAPAREIVGMVAGGMAAGCILPNPAVNNRPQSMPQGAQ